ncbi:MAG: transporter substrate-binding domain-containing protein, partial [Alphaproteobacteria bacterium]|nr:transporter substrate-binding domain-containing protein [Alphaproteobacteria bacterium]
MKVAAILVALLALSGVALAQSQPQPQAQPKPATKPAAAPAKPTGKGGFPAPTFKITIATEGAYPPFNYLDRKGLPAGFEMELAQEACQRIKAECEFAAYKWDDLIPGLLDK